MKFKKIVGFGDSWMFGDELLDPELVKQEPDAHSCWTQNIHYRESHCALGLLGQRYKVPTENFGIPGGSLRSTLWTYLWWLENETLPISDCLVLVYLTNADRESFYHPKFVAQGPAPVWEKFVHSAWARFDPTAVPTEFSDMIKLFTVLSTSSPLSELNYREAVYFFEGQQKIYNMPLIQVNVALPPCLVNGLITLARPEFNLVRHFLEHPKRQELYMPRHHPNENGHIMIADMLQEEINRAIL